MHTPLYTSSRKPRLPRGWLQGSRQLQGASQSPFPSPRPAAVCRGSNGEGHPVHLDGPQAAATQVPHRPRSRRPPARLAHHGSDCQSCSCNSHTGRRSGPQNTLQGWARARSRKPSLYGRAAAAPPSPAAALPPPSPPPPHNATRAPPQIARSHSSARGPERTWHLT